MSEDIASRLRELARDHSEERLALASYRQLRAPLLDSLIGRASAAAGPEVITQPRAAARGSTAAPEVPAQPATEPGTAQPGGEGRPRAGNFTKLAVGGGVALVAVLAVGAWLALGARHGPAPGGSAASAANTTVEAESDPLRAELQSVLDTDDWSPARLIKANTALVEAGPQRVQALAATDWFQRFKDAVRQRVKEQQALGAPLTPDKSPLAALAATIGLEVAAAGETPLPESAPRQVAGASPAAPKAATAEVAAAPPGSSSSPRPATAVPAAAAAEVSAPPGSSPRASAPVAGSAKPAASNAATSPAAGTTPPAQAAGCQRHFCQDPLSTGEPGIRLAIIPPGTYTMGNADVSTERPTRQVTIRQSFAISTEEISQGEFRWYCVKTGKPCPAQPSWAGDDYPVVNVSWSDATEYARWLSQVTGKRYRLPTEAEWEYAARAGQAGLFPQGDSLNPVDAYFSDKAKLAAPAPRSQDKDFNANPWHLYHMIGNVREWVQDSWEASYEGAPADGSAREKSGVAQRVVRGGSYTDGRAKLRLTTREGLNADTRDAITGIRLVRELP